MKRSSKRTNKLYPYRPGYNTKKLTETLSKISSDKSLRAQKVDISPVKEVKGKENWLAYLEMEMSELLAQEIDAGTTEVLQKQTENFHRLMERSSKVAKELKDAEYKIRQSVTKMEGEVNKKIKEVALGLSRLKANMDAMAKSQKILNKGISSEIKGLNTSLVQIVQEGSRESAASMQGMITQLLKTMEATIAEAKTVIIGEVQQSAGSLSKQTTDQVTAVTDRLDALTSRIDSLTERIDGHQESLINILDDNQAAMVQDMQQGFSLLDQNEMARAESLAAKLMELEEKMDQLNEEFNARLSGVEEVVTQALAEMLQTQKENLNKEVTGIRDILATIRSDIELQKRVLLDLSR